MSTELVARSVALVAADGAAVAAPARVLVMPAGEHEVRGVRWSADRAAADEIMADFAAMGRDLLIDYEHQSLGGEYAGPGGIAPAAGWITALAWEEGAGLWAAVTWTERAAALIAAREYRYLSPVLYVRREDGRPIALGSVALTNDPAIAGMRPIAASRRDDERRARGASRSGAASDRGRDGDRAMRTIASSLGLPDGADEAAVLGAIGELRARAERGEALRQACSGALGLSADAGQDVIVAAAQRLRGATDSAVPRTEFDAVAASLRAATDELGDLRRRMTDRAAEERIVAAMRAGQLTEAMLAPDDTGANYFRALARDEAQWSAFVARQPVVAPPDGQRLAASTPRAVDGDVIRANAARFDASRMSDYDRIAAHAREHKVSFERAAQACGAL